jgi:hypothetical protein
MTTWIGHLRIAEHLLAQIPALDEIAFAYGNLGPDSGMPNADCTAFEPPKSVTHFIPDGGTSENKIHDLTFYHVYLKSINPSAELVRYSFALGYFCHLLADGLWMRWVVVSSKQAYQAEFTRQGQAFWEVLKRDWYDLDFLYLRDHPQSLFWRSVAITPNPPAYFPFLVEQALHYSMDNLRQSYTHPKPERLLDRRYPWLNAAVMDRYVDEAASDIHWLLLELERSFPPEAAKTALAMLPEGRLSPFPLPLGNLM